MKKVINKILVGIIGVIALATINTFGYRFDVMNATNNLQHVPATIPQLWKDALAKDPSLLNPVDIKIYMEADTTLWKCNKKTWQGVIKPGLSQDLNWTGWCAGACLKYVKLYSIDSQGNKKEIELIEIGKQGVGELKFAFNARCASVNLYIMKLPNNQLIAIHADSWEDADGKFSDAIRILFQKFVFVK